MANEKNLPQQESGDVAHLAIKAAISAIPIIGGPGAELFSAIITPPLAKRRAEWEQSIVEELMELAKKVEGVSIDALQNNQQFVTAVTHATLIAIKTHHKEKLEALKNAVLNTAIGRAPEENLQLMLLNLADTLTPWHIHVLSFFRNPDGYFSDKGLKYHEPSGHGILVGKREFITILDQLQVFVELKGRVDLLERIFDDLTDKGLLNVMPSALANGKQAIFEKRTSWLGDEFLTFISSPLS